MVLYFPCAKEEQNSTRPHAETAAPGYWSMTKSSNANQTGGILNSFMLIQNNLFYKTITMCNKNMGNMLLV